MKELSPPQAAAMPTGHRVADIARCLGMPRGSVYRLIRLGILPACRVAPGTIVVLDDDLRAFLDSRRTVPK